MSLAAASLRSIATGSAGLSLSTPSIALLFQPALTYICTFRSYIFNSNSMMVSEFDAVVFSEPIGEVLGPVKTQFGYHLIKIISRKD